jgi:hypothetical protein
MMSPFDDARDGKEMRRVMGGGRTFFRPNRPATPLPEAIRA